MKTKEKIYLFIIIALVLILSSLDGKREAEEDKESTEICKLQDTENNNY